MKTQFIIQESNKKKREEIIYYVFQNYNMKDFHGQSKEYMIHSSFPLVLDIKNQFFFALESITCCAIAAQKHQIISFTEFLKKCQER